MVPHKCDTSVRVRRRSPGSSRTAASVKVGGEACCVLYNCDESVKLAGVSGFTEL